MEPALHIWPVCALCSLFASGMRFAHSAASHAKRAREQATTHDEECCTTLCVWGPAGSTPR